MFCVLEHILKNAAENYSVIPRMALILIKSETLTKRSLKGNRLKAGWDNEYLFQSAYHC
jgi:hypothetical protein